MRNVKRRAFTLVEILVVVVILGIVAAIVIPAFGTSRRESQDTVFLTNLRVCTESYWLYHYEHNSWPADEQPGVMPEGMDPYMTNIHWDNATPIGGQWDWDYLQFGCEAGVSVYLPDRTDVEMAALDAVTDDGDSTTGSFRQRESGWISVIKH